MLDHGIAGKKALVCASSRGLGYGCASALAKAGADLVMCARGAQACLLYTSPSPRDLSTSRMPSSA